MPLLDEIFGTTKPKQSNDTEVKSSVLDEAFSQPSTAASADASSIVPDNVPTPEKFKQQWEAQGSKNPVPEDSGIVKGIKANPLYLPLPVGDFADKTIEHAVGGINTALSGVKDIFQNQSATGVGKVGMGALGTVFSPISAASDVIGEETGKLIGNKDFGNKVGVLATAGLPVGKAIEMMPANKAFNQIIDKIGTKRLPQVIDELKSNPRLSLMDVDSNLLQAGQRLTNIEGPHQQKLVDFVENRATTAKQSVGKITENNLGVPVNLMEKVDKLKQAARDVGSKEITPVLNSTGPVDLTPVIKEIDNVLKPGVQSVITAGKPLPLGSKIKEELSDFRNILTDNSSIRTNAKELHDIQSGLRSTADNLLNSADGQTRRVGHALMEVRNNIVDAIDKSSGGTYKPTLAKYRDEMQVGNAFEMGQLVTRNKLGRVEDTPEFWEKWTKDASKEELQAAREGARLAIYHQLKAFRTGDRKTENIAQIELNVDKLKTLFGEKEINGFVKLLNDERNIAVNNTKLYGGSQTAARQEANAMVDLPVRNPSNLTSVAAPIMEMAGLAATGGTPLVGSALYWGSRAAGAAKHNLIDLPLAKTKNDRITDLLTATGPEREEVIKMLENHLQKSQPKLSIGSKARLALPFASP